MAIFDRALFSPPLGAGLPENGMIPAERQNAQQPSAVRKSELNECAARPAVAAQALLDAAISVLIRACILNVGASVLMDELRGDL